MRTVLMVIACLTCAGSALAVDWEITEIPVSDEYSKDNFYNFDIDDYGHLYWVHQFQNCDANGGNCTPSTHTLYRYDWATDSVSTIAQLPQGIYISMSNNYTYSSGTNIAWRQYDGSAYDIFFYDGDEVTQVTNTPGISEQIIGVSGDSVYYKYAIVVSYPYDVSYRLFHAVKYETVGGPLDCNTVRSFGYTLDSDLSSDCYVNFKDFAVFAQEWLECNDPNDPNCTHPWE